jgi:hypothetical protein
MLHFNVHHYKAGLDTTWRGHGSHFQQIYVEMSYNVLKNSDFMIQMQQILHFMGGVFFFHYIVLSMYVVYLITATMNK